MQLRAKTMQKKDVLAPLVAGAVAALCLAERSFAQAQPPKSRRSTDVGDR